MFTDIIILLHSVNIEKLLTSSATPFVDLDDLAHSLDDLVLVTVLVDDLVLFTVVVLSFDALACKLRLAVMKSPPFVLVTECPNLCATATCPPPIIKATIARGHSARILSGYNMINSYEARRRSGDGPTTN